MGLSCSTCSGDESALVARDLSPEKLSASYKGMCGVFIDALVADLWGSHDTYSAELRDAMRSTKLYDKMFRAAAMVAQGDGILSDMEANYVKKIYTVFFPYVDPAQVIEEIRNESFSVERLTTALNEVQEVYLGNQFDKFGTFWDTRKRILPTIIFFIALKVASQDGLAQEELDASFHMADHLNVSRDTAQRIIILLGMEQREIILLNRLRTGAVERFASVEKKPDIQLDLSQMNAAYAGRAGYSIMAYFTRMHGKPGDKTALLEQILNASPQGNFMEAVLKMAAIVAKGDGVLSESEEKKVRDDAEKFGLKNVDEIVRADPEELPALMERVRAIREHATDRLAGEGDMGENLLLLLHHFSLYVMLFALSISLQDGLHEQELEMADKMASVLEIDPRVLADLLTCFRIEQHICAEFFDALGMPTGQQ